jgi:biopolymer transport protein ExbD
MERCHQVHANSFGTKIARRLAVAAAAALLVIGCTPSKPATIVKLEVSEFGSYSLQGKPVKQGALIEALLSEREPGKQLVVHVIPSPRAKYEAVQAAMQAIQQVGGSVGIVGNERF